MHLFTSCFIGIPLPKQFVAEYQQIQDEAAKLLPNFDPANPEIPHITLYYLGSQIVENLDEIMRRAKLHGELLLRERLTVNGLDYFRHHDPRVLFLQVEHSPRVEQYYRVVKEELSSYRNEQDTRDFHAHLTVGRMRTDESQKEFIEHQTEVMLLGQGVDWGFEIAQIALFGVDSEQPNEGQQIIRLETL